MRWRVKCRLEILDDGTAKDETRNYGSYATVTVKVDTTTTRSVIFRWQWHYDNLTTGIWVKRRCKLCVHTISLVRRMFVSKVIFINGWLYNYIFSWLHESRLYRGDAHLCNWCNTITIAYNWHYYVNDYFMELLFILNRAVDFVSLFEDKVWSSLFHQPVISSSSKRSNTSKRSDGCTSNESLVTRRGGWRGRLVL